MTSTFAADGRVRAMWLGGSLARGDADEASDLDVLVAVADDVITSFAEEWQTWLAAITPTLVARPLPFLPGSLYSLTDECLRLDVVVETAGQIPTTGFRHRALVFDRDGLDAQVPEPEPGKGPDPSRIAGLVEEFFRDYGMFDVVTVRGDGLLGLEAIHFLRGLLYQLLVESNAPHPPMGVKRWSDRLTPEQITLLEQLPAASVDTVVADHEAVGVAFVRAAREICTAHQVPWPTDLEAAVCRHLAERGLPHLEDA